MAVEARNVSIGVILWKDTGENVFGAIKSGDGEVITLSLPNMLRASLKGLLEVKDSSTV